MATKIDTRTVVNVDGTRALHDVYFTQFAGCWKCFMPHKYCSFTKCSSQLEGIVSGIAYVLLQDPRHISELDVQLEGDLTMHLGDDQEVFKWLASKKRIACGGMEMMNILRLVCAHLGLVLK